MITAVIRKSYTSRRVAPGADLIIASMPIPPGGVFAGFRAEIHGVSSTHSLITDFSAAHIKGCIVGTGGSMMDASLSLDTLWDQMVPKDVDLNVAATEDDIDWDDGAITTPFEEPGHINWNDMMQLGVRPLPIVNTHVFTSLASGSKFPHVDTTDQTYVTWRRGIGSNKKVRVKAPSYFLLAVSSPSWDETTGTVPSTIAEFQYSLLTYPDVMFDMMLPDILGMTETGAESPFSNAASAAVDFVEPVIHEDNAGDFFAHTWHVGTKYMVRILTPGRPQMRGLSSGAA